MFINSARFITSASSLRETSPPLQYPEIVVVGRSNVGKSSFICKLTRTKIAKVSSTPGKTRLINYFLIDQRWYLVDLPGYGFAKVSKIIKERWAQAMEEYLAKRQGIRLAILLVDCRHPVKESDLQMYAWLQENSLPTQVVLTKIDKIGKNQLQRQLAETARAFNLAPSDLLALSSQSGQGFESLEGRLKAALQD